jgi:hypothetical protein
VLRLLLEGGDFLTHDEEQGWALTVKNNKQDISAFYSATIHLLVSDAEPLFVRMHGRVMQLQEKLCKYWHSESAVDAVSKLLPCLELRSGKENALVLSLRSSLNSIAKKRLLRHLWAECDALLCISCWLCSKRREVLEPAWRIRKRIPRFYR